MFFRAVLFVSSSFILPNTQLFVNNFFLLFYIALLWNSATNFDILSHSFSFVNKFLNFIFKLLFCHADIKRRRRDLNPRAGHPTYTLSRGTSSATWVLLLFNYVSHPWRKSYSIWFSFICQHLFIIFSIFYNSSIFLPRPLSFPLITTSHQYIKLVLFQVINQLNSIKDHPITMFLLVTSISSISP